MAATWRASQAQGRAWSACFSGARRRLTVRDGFGGGRGQISGSPRRCSRRGKSRRMRQRRVRTLRRRRHDLSDRVDPRGVPHHPFVAIGQSPVRFSFFRERRGCGGRMRQRGAHRRVLHRRGGPTPELLLADFRTLGYRFFCGEGTGIGDRPRRVHVRLDSSVRRLDSISRTTGRLVSSGRLSPSAGSVSAGTSIHGASPAIAHTRSRLI